MDGGDTLASRKALATAILAAKDNSLADALALADSMSITDVVETLYHNKPDLQFDHSELCDRFISAWLERLSTVERFVAAENLDGLYSLGLAWLPHAQDRSWERILRLASSALEEVAVVLTRAESDVNSPDTSFDSVYAAKLVGLAEGPLADVSRVLTERADELTGLQAQADAEDETEE